MVTTTYWKRVRFHGDTVPWILKEIPGKGLATFATRSFKAGEWICTEFPVTWVEGHHPFSEEQVNTINNKVKALSDEDKEAFFAMANVFDRPDDNIAPAAGVFMTNSFDMTESIYGTSCAMYLALARINHSCIPNVQQTHVPETTEEVLYAARDIAEGEELNDCYIELRQPRAARQAELSEHYRFHCECSACTGTFSDSSTVATSSSSSSNSISSGSNSDTSICSSGSSPQADTAEAVANRIAEDDRVRVRAAQVGDILVDLVAADQHDTALAVATQMVRLLEQPRYTVWSARYLAEVCLSVHQIASELGRWETAREFLTKAHRMNVQLTGPSSSDSKATADLLARMA